MKKSCVFVLAAVLTLPAFAASDKVAADKIAEEPLEQEESLTQDLDSALQPETLDESVSVASSNPDIKFPRGMQLGLGVSATSGLNGFVGYNNKKFDSFWWKRLGIRLDFASTKPMRSVIDKMVDKYMGDGIKIGDNLTITDGEIESRHMAALIDFYPFGDTWFLGGWRLTGGYMFGKFGIEAMLTGNDDALAQYAGKRFQLGNHIWEYTGGDVHGTAKADWNIKGPYAGTGFDIGLFSGFKIFMDMGVVFTNKAAELSLDIPYESAPLKYSSDGGNTWTDMSVPSEYADVVNTLRGDIDDTIADAQKELDKYKFFPVIKMGFMYRF